MKHNKKKLPCGHTEEEHKQFGRLTPEEQEILQHQCGCFEKPKMEK